MSFHVEFLAPAGHAPGGADLLAAVREIPGMAAPPAIGDRARVEYHARVTGVRATLVRAPAEEGAPAPEGWEPAGLHLEVPFLRPGFHGAEAAEVAGRLAAALELRVLGPAGGSALAPTELGEVDAAYREANAREVAAQREKLAARVGLPLVLAQVLPAARADAWWRFRRAEAGLRARLGKAVVVPGPMILRPEGSRELVTAVAWTNGAAIVLPDVDRLFLMRGVVDGRPEDVALVDAAAAREELAAWLEPVEGVAGAAVLPGARALLARPWFDSAAGLPGVDAFEQVPSDGFTDVPFPDA